MTPAHHHHHISDGEDGEDDDDNKACYICYITTISVMVRTERMMRTTGPVLHLSLIAATVGLARTVAMLVMVRTEMIRITQG